MERQLANDARGSEKGVAQIAVEISFKSSRRGGQSRRQASGSHWKNERISENHQGSEQYPE